MDEEQLAKSLQQVYDNLYNKSLKPGGVTENQANSFSKLRPDGTKVVVHFSLVNDILDNYGLEKTQAFQWEGVSEDVLDIILDTQYKILKDKGIQESPQGFLGGNYTSVSPEEFKEVIPKLNNYFLGKEVLLDSQEYLDEAGEGAILKYEGKPITPTDTVDREILIAEILEEFRRMDLDDDYLLGLNHGFEFLEPQHLWADLTGPIREAIEIPAEYVIDIEDGFEKGLKKTNLSTYVEFDETTTTNKYVAKQLTPEGLKVLKTNMKQKIINTYMANLDNFGITDYGNDPMYLTKFRGSTIKKELTDQFATIVNSKEFDNILNKIYDPSEFFDVIYAQSMVDEQPRVKILEGGVPGGEWLGIAKDNPVYKNTSLSSFVDDVIINAYENDYEINIKDDFNKIKQVRQSWIDSNLPEGWDMPAYQRAIMIGEPEPLLKSKTSVFNRTATVGGELSGISYHGQPTTSAQGREVIKILQTGFPDLLDQRYDGSVMHDYNAYLESQINKISTESNLDWLNPKRVGGNTNLRGGALYTTSNPFVAASYGKGGHDDVLPGMDAKFIKLVESMLNHETNGVPELLSSKEFSVFDLDSSTSMIEPEILKELKDIMPTKIQEIKIQLNKIGLDILTEVKPVNMKVQTKIDDGNFIKNGMTNSPYYTIVDLQTQKPKRFILPNVMENQFTVPANNTLYIEQPLYRLTEKRHVREAIANVLRQINPDNVPNDQVIKFAKFIKPTVDIGEDLTTAGNNLESYYSTDYGAMVRPPDVTDGMDRKKVEKLINTAISNPDSEEFRFLKQVYSDFNTATKNDMYEQIKKIVDNTATDTRHGNSWVDIAEEMSRSSLRYQTKGISPQMAPIINKYLIDFGIEGYKTVDLGQIAHDKALGEYMSSPSFNAPDVYPNNIMPKNKKGFKARMDYKSYIDFIKQLDLNLLGGATRATYRAALLQEIFKNDIGSGIDVFEKEFLESYEVFPRLSRTNIEGPPTTATVESSNSFLEIFSDKADEVLQDIDFENYEKLDFNNINLDPVEIRRAAQLKTEEVVNSNLYPQFDVDTRAKLKIFEMIDQTQDNNVSKGFTGFDDYTIDQIDKKALSDAGIEIMIGSGGGRVGNDVHDVFMIVDPGDVYGNGLPRNAKFKTRAIEIQKEEAEILEQISTGNKELSKLSDNEIKAVSRFVGLETILEDQFLSETTKEKWSDIYSELEIKDDRFYGNLEASVIDGAYLNKQSALRDMINISSTGGVIPPEIIQKQTAEVIELATRNVAPQDVPKVLKSTGLLKMLGNGLDVFDAALLGPVAIDLIMSRATGAGKDTETIGGAVADVADKIYDPNKEDTVFENLYGSPEDSGTLAGAASETMEIGKEFYIDPLIRAGKNNPIINSMFTSFKDTGVAALNNIKDGLGMNDWIYNLKRDMFIAQDLKQNKITDPNYVTQLEKKYEINFPREIDKYGREIDVSN